MIQEEVIEPDNTGWARNIVFVTKKDGALRCFVDYRKLNALTMRDYYLLPMRVERIDSLEEARIFPILDANSGYWQPESNKHVRPETPNHNSPWTLPIRPRAVRRRIHLGDTATIDGRYTVISKMVTNARLPRQYRRLPKNVSVHMTLLPQALILILDAEVTLKLKKCLFFAEKINYLGNII